MLKLFSQQVGLLNFFYRGLKIKIIKKFKKKFIYKTLTKNNYTIFNWDPNGTEIFITQCFTDWGNEYLFLDSVKQRKKGYFLDVGCHTGYFPSLFKGYFYKIIGFEPSDKCINILNKFKDENFSYQQCFVGNKNIEVEGEENESGYSFYQTTSNHKSFFKKKLKQITLDTFCSENNLRNITAIKIDVDGIDLEVLDGAKKIVKKNRPSILIENYSKDLFIYFKDLNYSLLSISSSISKPYNLYLEELKSYDEKKWIKMVCCIPNEFKKYYKYNTFKGNLLTGINKKKLLQIFKY